MEHGNQVPDPSDPQQRRAHQEQGHKPRSLGDGRPHQGQQGHGRQDPCEHIIHPGLGLAAAVLRLRLSSLPLGEAAGEAPHPKQEQQPAQHQQFPVKPRHADGNQGHCPHRQFQQRGREAFPVRWFHPFHPFCKSFLSVPHASKWACRCQGPGLWVGFLPSFLVNLGKFPRECPVFPRYDRKNLLFPEFPCILAEICNPFIHFQKKEVTP